MASNPQGGDLNNMIQNMSPEQRQQLADLVASEEEGSVAQKASGEDSKVKAVFKSLRGDVFGRLPRNELADALLQFKFLNDSGCEMLRTLEILSNSRHPLISKIFADIRGDVENGIALGDAFEKHEKQVGRVTVSTIRAAEESGTLSNSLQFLADNIHQDEEVRTRVKRALSYPITTAVFTITVFILCVMFVVPQFADLYDKTGGEATGVTAVMISLSGFLNGFWFLWIPALILGAFFFLRWWRSSPEVLDRFLLRLPMVARLITLSDMARFSDRLGLLLRSGVPIVKAVNLAKETVANTVLRPLFARMAAQAETGRSLADAFTDIRNVPEGVVDMIRVGEDAGALADTLTIGAGNIRKEMDRLYDQLTRWLQPIGILLVAGIVLVLVVALFTPYIEMLENLSQMGGAQ